MAGRKDSRGRVLKKGECQRKDGRYSYAYTDPSGKRRYIYANDLMKLRSKEQQLQKDQLDGLDIYTAGKATVNYVFDRYLSMKSELRSSTYTSYVYMYDRYVRDTFGKKLVAEVKYSDVMFFYERLMQNYKLQVGTVDKIHTLIHPIFKLAVRDSIIRINPADGCMAEIKKKSTTGANKRKALTIPQQKAFIDYTQHSEVYYRWAPLFTVLLGTGCRVGEIIGLRWEDVDFAERTININHSVSYRADAKDDFRCSYSVSKPKTEAGIRNVPMLDAVYEALQDEKRYQKIEGSNEMTIDGMSGFIFRNRYGAVHNPQGINKAIKRVSDAYNAEEIIKAKKEKREPILIPHFTCHHMRHTFCTRLCEQEPNVKVIQEIMGHKNIQTTLDIYADATEEAKKESMVRLSEKLDVF